MCVEDRVEGRERVREREREREMGKGGHFLCESLSPFAHNRLACQLRLKGEQGWLSLYLSLTRSHKHSLTHTHTHFHISFLHKHMSTYLSLSLTHTHTHTHIHTLLHFFSTFLHKHTSTSQTNTRSTSLTLPSSTHTSFLGQFFKCLCHSSQELWLIKFFFGCS